MGYGELGRLETWESAVDTFWFLAEWHDLDLLAREIRREHQREPDPGDLLIVLASQRDTVAGELMAELGIDVDELAEKLEALSTKSCSRETRMSGSRTCANEKNWPRNPATLRLQDRLRGEEGRLTRQLVGTTTRSPTTEMRRRLRLS